MREHWGSRLGFILAALGSAIGLGTLWKFPYVTGENGGGLFVFFYLVFTLLIGIPLFIGELILGRRAQRGAVGIFAELSGESTPWKAAGWLGVLSSFLILSYDCVVAGWGLNYLMLSLNQFYEHRTSDEIASAFEILYKSGDISLFWALIFLLLTLGVVLQGVRKGIERWNRILTTALLVLLALLCLYACSLSGFPAAIRFLFLPDLSHIRWSGILEALGLSLFTLSLAQGIILTYGSYLRENEDLPKTALIVGLSVVVVSLITVLTLFPVVFTFHLRPEEGAGMVFKTLPVLFAALPGSMVVSALFFLLFVFTGLTSAVALLEVVAANLIDLYQWSRRKAVICSTVATFIVGIPSAFAGSQHIFPAWMPMYGMNFFLTVDYLVSVWLLPFGAFLIALYLGWRVDRKMLVQEFCQGSRWRYLFSLWFFLVRWIVPIGIILIFLQKAGFIL